MNSILAAILCRFLAYKENETALTSVDQLCCLRCRQTNNKPIQKVKAKVICALAWIAWALTRKQICGLDSVNATMFEFQTSSSALCYPATPPPPPKSSTETPNIRWRSSLDRQFRPLTPRRQNHREKAKMPRHMLLSSLSWRPRQTSTSLEGLQTSHCLAFPSTTALKKPGIAHH
jgi:hypothetical protein